MFLFELCLFYLSVHVNCISFHSYLKKTRSLHQAKTNNEIHRSIYLLFDDFVMCASL